MTTKTTATGKKKLSKAEQDAYSVVARAGGRALAEKLGKEGMSALGAKGAKKRWKGHKKVNSK